MKAKIKYLYLCLLMISVLILGACARKEEESVPPDVAGELQAQTESLLKQIYDMDDIMLAQSIENTEINGQTVWSSGLEAFKAAKEEVGELVSIDSAKVSTEEGSYIVKLEYSGKNRKSEISIGYDKKTGAVSQFSVDPKYGLGENMKKAALNTLLGMGTVFIILIFISFLISLFKYVNIFENKFKNEKKDIKSEITKEEGLPESAALVDDWELVAVVTAAIAQFSNTDASNLIVRSVKRVKRR